MTDAAVAPLLVSTPQSQAVTTEQPLVRYVLIGVAVVFLVVFLFLPLASVFVEALRSGLGTYFASITEPDAADCTCTIGSRASISVSPKTPYASFGSKRCRSVPPPAHSPRKGRNCTSSSPLGVGTASSTRVGRPTSRL